MNRLRRYAALILCALLLLAGAPRAATVPCGGAEHAARTCCQGECHCTETAHADDCCGEKQPATPEAPAPAMPKPPALPDQPLPEPAPCEPGVHAAFAARAHFVLRVGHDVREGRLRHAVLSVWRN